MTSRRNVAIAVVSRLYSRARGHMRTVLRSRGSEHTPGPVVSTKPDGSTVCQMCGPVPVSRKEHLDWHEARHGLTGGW